VMLQREQQIQPTKTSSDVSDMSRATCEDINIDLKSYFSKSHISIPFLEFVKIPSQRKKIKQILGLGEGKEESSKNTHVILKTVEKGRLNGGCDPFYISLQVKNLLFQNCLLDSEASTNVMPLKTMQQLLFKVKRPYQNICSMDRRDVEVLDVIKNVVVRLNIYMDVSVMTDVVIYIPNSWRMFLSRNFTAHLGGSLQMDHSYATIPIMMEIF
jgi:hypothetical protein